MVPGWAWELRFFITCQNLLENDVSQEVNEKQSTAQWEFLCQTYFLLVAIPVSNSGMMTGEPWLI